MHFKLLTRPPDMYVGRSYLINAAVLFLSIHGSQQPRNGRQSNVFTRFGRR